MKLEIYEGSSGVWSWRLFGEDGKVLAHGAQTYKTRAGIEKGSAKRMSDALGKGLTETIVTPLEGEPESVTL